MLILVAKLVLAPVLIALVTLAGRRWGPEAAGWLAGIPITGGPILLFIAIEQGEPFAARTATAALCGLVAFTAHCLAFAWVAPRLRWWAALPVGWAAYFLAGWPLTQWHPPTLVAALAGAAALITTAMLLPRPRAAHVRVVAPSWEMPLRMAATAAVVLTVTGLAHWLGAGWSGVLTVFPTAATVLGAFALAQGGSDAVARTLRGMQFGMLCLTGFFATIALGLERFGLATTFALALAIALAGQALTLVVVRLARRRAVSVASAAG